MICEIICVDGFLCMSHLDIVHISSVCVHIICILSEHMRIMHILSALCCWFSLQSFMFFPNRQCQCDLYMSSLLLFIDPMMYNLVSIQCLHKHTLSMPSTCCMHIYTLFVMYLSHSLYILLPAT